MVINGNGLAEKGFGVDELSKFHEDLTSRGFCSEIYRLDHIDIVKDVINIEPASVLIIRNGMSQLTGVSHEEFFNEQIALEWDKSYWDTRRSKVLNKIARYNVCYGDVSQVPDYPSKRGIIHAYKDIPILDIWRKKVGEFFGEGATNLETEGNLYYNSDKCGIGFHGDSERKKVIACSLGESRPLHWQWYHDSKPIGARIEFVINSGDMYIMSEKATGHDWKRRKILTLRHAAGTAYVKVKVPKAPK